MTKEKKNPYGIKTPTSVSEFRENLRKYYLTIPHPTKGVDYGDIRDFPEGRNDFPIDCYSLNMKETGGLMIKDISSFRDIYKNTETGFSGDGTSPSICPLLTFNKRKNNGHQMVILKMNPTIRFGLMMRITF